MRVVVVGASGAVGRELLRLLTTRAVLPAAAAIVPVGSRSAGSTLPIAGEPVEVSPLSADVFAGADLALFSAGGGVSREWAPIAAAQGAIVVDNSSAFRMDADVPLVVPEVNADALDAGPPPRGIVANPNCTTAVFAVAAAPIHRAVGIRRVIASSYQAVSGSGAGGIRELDAQVRAWSAGAEPPPREVYPHPIAFNVLPHVDGFAPEYAGFTREELKLRDESRKILNAPDLRVSATCVRVPTFRAHAVSAHLELAGPCSPGRVRDLLAAAPGVIVDDEPEAARYPLPLSVAGQDDVAVGRIRACEVFDPGIVLWIVGDQLLKGAALNAVQIAEALHARGMLIRAER
jgi:aspartate-semialdehyde dehydrogenase